MESSFARVEPEQKGAEKKPDVQPGKKTLVEHENVKESADKEAEQPPVPSPSGGEGIASTLHDKLLGLTGSDVASWFFTGVTFANQLRPKAISATEMAASSGLISDQTKDNVTKVLTLPDRLAGQSITWGSGAPSATFRIDKVNPHREGVVLQTAAIELGASCHLVLMPGVEIDGAIALNWRPFVTENRFTIAGSLGFNVATEHLTITNGVLAGFSGADGSGLKGKADAIAVRAFGFELGATGIDLGTGPAGTTFDAGKITVKKGEDVVGEASQLHYKNGKLTVASIVVELPDPNIPYVTFERTSGKYTKITLSNIEVERISEQANAQLAKAQPADEKKPEEKSHLEGKFDEAKVEDLPPIKIGTDENYVRFTFANLRAGVDPNDKEGKKSVITGAATAFVCLPGITGTVSANVTVPPSDPASLTAHLTGKLKIKGADVDVNVSYEQKKLTFRDVTIDLTKALGEPDVLKGKVELGGTKKLKISEMTIDCQTHAIERLAAEATLGELNLFDRTVVLKDIHGSVDVKGAALSAGEEPLLGAKATWTASLSGDGEMDFLSTKWIVSGAAVKFGDTGFISADLASLSGADLDSGAGLGIGGVHADKTGLEVKRVKVTMDLARPPILSRFDAIKEFAEHKPSWLPVKDTHVEVTFGGRIDAGKFQPNWKETGIKLLKASLKLFGQEVGFERGKITAGVSKTGSFDVSWQFPLLYGAAGIEAGANLKYDVGLKGGIKVDHFGETWALDGDVGAHAKVTGTVKGGVYTGIPQALQVSGGLQANIMLDSQANMSVGGALTIPEKEGSPLSGFAAAAFDTSTKISAGAGLYVGYSILGFTGHHNLNVVAAELGHFFAWGQVRSDFPNGEFETVPAAKFPFHRFEVNQAILNLTGDLEQSLFQSRLAQAQQGFNRETAMVSGLTDLKQFEDGIKDSPDKEGARAGKREELQTERSEHVAQEEESKRLLDETRTEEKQVKAEKKEVDKAITTNQKDQATTEVKRQKATGEISKLDRIKHVAVTTHASPDELVQRKEAFAAEGESLQQLKGELGEHLQELAFAKEIFKNFVAFDKGQIEAIDAQLELLDPKKKGDVLAKVNTRLATEQKKLLAAWDQLMGVNCEAELRKANATQRKQELAKEISGLEATVKTSTQTASDLDKQIAEMKKSMQPASGAAQSEQAAEEMARKEREIADVVRRQRIAKLDSQSAASALTNRKAELAHLDVTLAKMPEGRGVSSLDPETVTLIVNAMRVHKDSLTDVLKVLEKHEQKEAKKSQDAQKELASVETKLQKERAKEEPNAKKVAELEEAHEKAKADVIGRQQIFEILLRYRNEVSQLTSASLKGAN